MVTNSASPASSIKKALPPSIDMPLQSTCGTSYNVLSDDFRNDLSLRLRSLGYREHDAEDAIQEALLRSIMRGESDPLRQPEAWFFTVSRNVAYTSVHRRRERNVEVFPEPVASPVNEIEEAEEWRQLVGAILAGIDQLPAPKRDIIYLRLFGDMTIREVAHSMRLGEGVVRGHIARALSSIRQHVLENCNAARNRYGM